MVNELDPLYPVFPLAVGVYAMAEAVLQSAIGLGNRYRREQRVYVSVEAMQNGETG
jgi:hypothetical protein